jgi:hypothetical protein
VGFGLLSVCPYCRSFSRDFLLLNCKYKEEITLQLDIDYGFSCCSVIVEAVKMDSLQKLCSTLEPLLRRVVGEEVERALAKFVPPKPGFR